MIEKHAVSEAAENLPGIVESVGNGNMVHLTGEDGHTLAVMMSLAEYHRLAHGWRAAPSKPIDMDEIIARFQEAFKADGCNLDGWLDGIRDESNGRSI